MGRAGYCSECQSNVWLTEDGGCVAGHPASSVSGAYDVQPAPEAPEPAKPARSSKRLIWLIVGLLIVVVVGIGLVAAVLAPRLVNTAGAIADEWKTRLAEDYPGWQPVGFNFRTFTGADGTETTYRFTLVHPERELSVPVEYVAQGEGSPVSQDEIIRPAGVFHDRADSLLDYIDRSYYDKGLSAVAVTGDGAGNATVEWVRVTRLGPFTSRTGSYDVLVFHEDTGEWYGADPEIP